MAAVIVRYPFTHLGVPNTVDVYPFSGHPNTELYINKYMHYLIILLLNLNFVVLPRVYSRYKDINVVSNVKT